MELAEKIRLEHHIVSRDLGVRIKQLKVIDASGAAYNVLRLKWMIWEISYGQWFVVGTLILSIVIIVGSIGVLSLGGHPMDLLVPRVFASKGEVLKFGVALCAFTLLFNALTLFRIFRNR